ncbi:hypothetical protein CVV38_00570 [Candidatus Peregrinibacteria bacterium HGW-Peregrinibacteria-1]|jgi:cation:H+ antiporter|nr:MAG: hypothetical protein CVV38_00570 [Candidatus Peregrinibacteria bacterium HGW-Peregrinibacteria-1]
MVLNLIIFAVSLFVVLRGTTFATKYAVGLAHSFGWSKYVVGFLVVALISILPETLISINSAIAGSPQFALGMLFSANVADLTLVFAIIIAVSGKGIKVESKILKNNWFFPMLLLLPLILGLNGEYSRVDGAVLLIAGMVFYYLVFQDGAEEALDNVKAEIDKDRYKNAFYLLVSMLAILVGAHFTVDAAVNFASALHVSPIIIGMFIVGLGTVIPELLFSIGAVKNNEDSLAVGDLLGTVLADATIVVGILALVSPFSFPREIIFSTGFFMLMAAIMLCYFMYTGKTVSRKESYVLFAFWTLFVIVELLIGL